MFNSEQQFDDSFDDFSKNNPEICNILEDYEIYEKVLISKEKEDLYNSEFDTGLTPMNEEANIHTNNILVDQLKLEKTEYIKKDVHYQPDLEKAVKSVFKPSNYCHNQSIVEYEDDKDNVNTREIISINNKKEKEDDNTVICELNDYLKEKKEIEKIFDIEKIPKEMKMDKNSPYYINKKKYKCGRKKKEEVIIRKHNKSSKDNIIIKIKGYFFQYIRDVVKKNSDQGKIDLKKISYKFISNVNKEKNENLFKMKIKDILRNEPITKKNKKSNPFENKNIIDKIYKSKKEKNVIKILELTFKELFMIFRKKLNYEGDKEEMKSIKQKIEGLDLLDENNKYKDINYLIEKLEQKNENKTEHQEYIEEIIRLCRNYERWFNNKITRTLKKIK